MEDVATLLALLTPGRLPAGKDAYKAMRWSERRKVEDKDSYVVSGLRLSFTLC